MDLFKGFLKVDGDSHLRVFNYQINITRNARCGEQKHELVNLHNLAKYHRNLYILRLSLYDVKADKLVL